MGKEKRREAGRQADGSGKREKGRGVCARKKKGESVEVRTATEMLAKYN